MLCELIKYKDQVEAVCKYICKRSYLILTADKYTIYFLHITRFRIAGQICLNFVFGSDWRCRYFTNTPTTTHSKRRHTTQANGLNQRNSLCISFSIDVAQQKIREKSQECVTSSFDLYIFLQVSFIVHSPICVAYSRDLWPIYYAYYVLFRYMVMMMVMRAFITYNPFFFAAIYICRLRRYTLGSLRGWKVAYKYTSLDFVEKCACRPAWGTMVNGILILLGTRAVDRDTT